MAKEPAVSPEQYEAILQGLFEKALHELDGITFDTNLDTNMTMYVQKILNAFYVVNTERRISVDVVWIVASALYAASHELDEVHFYCQLAMPMIALIHACFLMETCNQIGLIKDYVHGESPIFSGADSTLALRLLQGT